VSAIISFLPTEEVKKSDHFICEVLIKKQSAAFLHYEDKGFMKAIAAKIVQEPVVQCNCGLFLWLQNPSGKRHGKSR
jgi:hypothetical protein